MIAPKPFGFELATNQTTLPLDMPKRKAPARQGRGKKSKASEEELSKKGIVLSEAPAGSIPSAASTDEDGVYKVNVGEIGHRVAMCLRKKDPDGKWERGTVVKLNRSGICSMYKVLGVHVLLDHNRGVRAKSYTVN